MFSRTPPIETSERPRRDKKPEEEPERKPENFIKISLRLTYYSELSILNRVEEDSLR